MKYLVKVRIVQTVTIEAADDMKAGDLAVEEMEEDHPLAESVEILDAEPAKP